MYTFRNKWLNLLFLSVFSQVLCCKAVEASKAAPPSAPVKENKEDKEIDDQDSEFQPLADPYKYISGAYVGGGLDFSHMSYDVKLFEKNDKDVTQKMSKSTFQPALSVIGGFGTTFYKNWYAGLEFEFFKRFPKRSSKKDRLEVVFKSTLGFNMDAKLGYQFPNKGLMIYLTIGFARVLGSMSVKENDSAKPSRKTFGSFFPTIGFGAAYKVRQNWVVMGNIHYSIGSKEKKRFFYPSDREKYEQNIKNKVEDPLKDIPKRAMEGKPMRWGFGIYLVRQL